jgi:DUF2927 family protein
MAVYTRLRAAFTLVAGLGLAGCNAVLTSPLPVLPPDAARAPQPPVALPPESARLAAYYQRVEDGLLVQGLLRTDGGGPDVPYSARQLAETFEQIALFEEYTTSGNRLVARRNKSSLQRWRDPVVIRVSFGTSIPAEQQQRDSEAVTAYARRLARATGHPVRSAGTGANFNVLILNESERRTIGPLMRRLLPGISDAAVESAVNMPRSTYCAVYAIAPGGKGEFSGAVAIIRGEHPDLLRLSCIHEELAQGLGLGNDSPSARPSIFNDDEEFGLLTTMDEQMLSILYDRRLTPGMTAETARPIIRNIAAELTGGQS